jgi:hypothetical protein
MPSPNGSQSQIAAHTNALVERLRRTPDLPVRLEQRLSSRGNSIWGTGAQI